MTMIELKRGHLKFSFPEVHDGQVVKLGQKVTPDQVREGW